MKTSSFINRLRISAVLWMFSLVSLLALSLVYWTRVSKAQASSDDWIDSESFEKCGLGKLESGELEALHNWHIDSVVRAMSLFNEVDVPTLLTTYYNLSLISPDGTYLGKITSNDYDMDSIGYEYGDYGSKYSQKSIMNKYGTYGGHYSSYSPFNKFASDPPIIIDGTATIAYLTTNTSMTPRVDPYELVGYLIID
jgi:hypothetical protein